MANFKAIDEFLSEYVKTGPAGCGVAVAKGGETLYENYFGYANLEEKKPITADTVYRQFSATKIIICTAAMILYERGKFLLQDPIYEYFPEWRDTQVAVTAPDGTVTVRPVKRPIQVADCFNMCMGIGYGGTDYTHKIMNQVRANLEANDPKYTLRDDIRAMSVVPVAFDPGEHWLYGFGHELVAGMIEATSGMKVSEFLQKEIFEPLGMDHTGYRYFGNMRENMVTAYQLNPDGTRTPTVGMFDARHEPDATYEAGGAGLFSNVRDYVTFTQMLANGGKLKGERIIGRKTIDLMRQNRLNDVQMSEFTNSYLDGYGYGLGVRTLIDPARVSNSSVGEFGWTGAMGTYVNIDPSEQVSVVYMHNSVPNNEEYTHHRIRNMAFGALD